LKLYAQSNTLNTNISSTADEFIRVWDSNSVVNK